jgi:hypothetical protein
VSLADRTDIDRDINLFVLGRVLKERSYAAENAANSAMMVKVSRFVTGILG